MKVLLCLNGEKDDNRFVLDRNGVLLRYALESQNIEYTYDLKSDYDLVHLLSLNQYKAYLKNHHNKKKKVILSTFNDYADFKVDQNEEGEMKLVFSKIFKKVDKIDTLLVNWYSQSLLLKHNDVPFNVEVVNIGTKDYSNEKYSKVEQEAFRKYYRIPNKHKIIFSYGEYAYSKGFDYLEAISRIMPDYEFFFFGGKAGVLSNSKSYEKTNKINNLHYEDNIPAELYHSLLLNASALYLPYQFSTDSCIVLEAMKAKIPVISAPNPIIFDLLVDKKTCLIGRNVEEWYQLLKNIDTNNCVQSAYKFSKNYTIKKYGQSLLGVYKKLI